MKKTLSMKEYIAVASMLFGLFFGAGNLIFPVSMGQQAGSNMLPAALGFCITGAGLPLLGIAAMAISDSKGLFDMSCKVGKGFAYFFTVALYLTIGPLFAIPRTATVSFQVGITHIVGADAQALALFFFSLFFFVIVLLFSLRPSGILDWIGRILNPLFLFFLTIMVIAALLYPMGDYTTVAPTGKYVDAPFFTGLLEGYNTMDALASLAFGIILINVVHDLGVKDPANTAFCSIKSGIGASGLMFLIYTMLTLIGACSAVLFGVSEDGGIALFKIADNYFGAAGGALLGVMITLACVKTSIGLVTALSTTFSELFPAVCTYKRCAYLFTLVSFVIANAGLGMIIKLSIPVLMFLYPITIAIIFLCIFGKAFAYKKSVFIGTMTMTMIVAGMGLFDTVLDAAGAQSLAAALHGMESALPMADIGMGWILPAVCGGVVGFVAGSEKRMSREVL